MKVSEPYTIFPRTLTSGKIVYYYQYRMENGVRSSAKSTGCTTLASAKRYCNKLYNNGEFSKYSSCREEREKLESYLSQIYTAIKRGDVPAIVPVYDENEARTLIRLRDKNRQGK